MMVDSKWIQISLFLVAELQFTAAEENPPSFTVRDGGEVTLPCGNVTDGQQNCNRTTWVFSVSRRGYAVELVALGRADSVRLSVTENCSLVIKKVTVQDVGLYTCRQFDKSGQEQGPDSEVDLSVVTMTGHTNDDQATLNCHVSTYGKCTHKVQWLYRPGDFFVRTSESSCSASVDFLSSDYLHNRFWCEVTDGNKQQEFYYRPWPPCESPGQERTTATTKPTTTEDPSKAPTGCSAVNYIMLVLRVAELVLITVITVLLIRAPGNQRPPDDDVVKYENFGDSSASVRLR